MWEIGDKQKLLELNNVAENIARFITTSYPKMQTAELAFILMCLSMKNQFLIFQAYSQELYKQFQVECGNCHHIKGQHDLNKPMNEAWNCEVEFCQCQKFEEPIKDEK